MPFANRWCWVAFACVGLGGCAASPKPVLSVAQYDLSCSAVEVSRVDDEHYAASGCGRGAVYVQSCDDGAGCRWARMRHGHEVDVAAAQAPLMGVPQQRQIIGAPPPEQRQIMPAPPPGSREVIPAPPPDATSGGNAAPGAAVPTSGQDSALSAPYQAEVPAVPTSQQTQYTPPAPLVEDRPPPPSPSYVWVGGYWWSGDWGWTWVPGYWTPPRPGYAWYGGGWYWYSSYWWYYPGGWCYPGTRTIVYAPSPRPTRVVTVRTIRPNAGAHGSTVIASAPRPAPSSFHPQGSPLLHYPSPAMSSRLVPSSASSRLVPPSSQVQAFHPGQPNHSSFGRLVRPNESVPPRSSYGSHASSLGYGGSSASHFGRTPSSSVSSHSFSRPHGSSSFSSHPSSRPPASSFHVPSHGGGGSMHSIHPRR
jgi:hypothetical protein